MENLYTHTALNLIVVLVLMLGFIYLLKKFNVNKVIRNNHIKIINSVGIGTKERIILMEVNKTFLLVGATPSHIETLYVFNELEETKSNSNMPDFKTTKVMLEPHENMASQA